MIRMESVTYSTLRNTDSDDNSLSRELCIVNKQHIRWFVLQLAIGIANK